MAYRGDLGLGKNQAVTEVDGLSSGGLLREYCIIIKLTLIMNRLVQEILFDLFQWNVFHYVIKVQINTKLQIVTNKLFTTQHHRILYNNQHFNGHFKYTT